MMVKQHMLFTLCSICGIVLKGKSASNFKAAYAVLCNLGAHHHYAPRRKGIMLWNGDDLHFHNISKGPRVSMGTVSR